jgi:hypothetical protein
MRKPPAKKLPNQILDMEESIGVGNESLDFISQSAVKEVLSVGRYGLYLDASTDTSGSSTPYATEYFAESIVNWKEEKINGRKQLVLVVLRETFEKFEDEFTSKEEPQFRVLKLTTSDGQIIIDDIVIDENNLVYSVEIWRKKQESSISKQAEDEYEKVETIVPRRRGGNTLNYIPFVIIGVNSISSDVEKPPILDQVNVNYSHYRTSADLEHGRHFTSLPTPWVSGVPLDQVAKATSNFRIGSIVAWLLPLPESRAGYLEFTGKGLESLERALKEKGMMMAVLGARLLEPQRPGVEAAETVRLRQSGEGNVLSNISKSVSEGVEVILSWMADWLGLDEDVEISYQLNTDFNVATVDSRMIIALMAALQAGNLSFETWFYNLEKGEVTPPGITAEDEIKRIEDGGPTPLVPVIPGESDIEVEDEEAA